MVIKLGIIIDWALGVIVMLIGILVFSFENRINGTAIFLFGLLFIYISIFEPTKPEEVENARRTNSKLD